MGPQLELMHTNHIYFHGKYVRFDHDKTKAQPLERLRDISCSFAQDIGLTSPYG